MSSGMLEYPDVPNTQCSRETRVERRNPVFDTAETLLDASQLHYRPELDRSFVGEE